MYSHANTMRIDQVGAGYHNPAHATVKTLEADCPLQGADVAELMDAIEIDMLLNDLDEWMLREARKYADELYSELEKAYDHEMSDDHITELADINEWEFDETGRIV